METDSKVKPKVKYKIGNTISMVQVLGLEPTVIGLSWLHIWQASQGYEI